MEDTETKIHPTLLNIEREIHASNYKDATVFDIDADIKQNLLYERQQFSPLAKNFMQFLRLGVRDHALIIGPRGSGKTAIVKYILKEAKKIPGFNFDYIYINCRSLDNSYKVMKGVIREKKKIPKDHVMYAFVDEMKKHDKKIFLILDEADLLRDDDLLYNITRRDDLSNVCLVLITKTPKFYENLSGDVKSSMKKETFYFDTYGYSEIKNILSKRAEIGLKAHDEHVLFQIAVSNVNNASSDVRVGIRVLEQLFKNSDYPVSEKNGDGKLKVPDEITKKINDSMEQEYMKMKEGVIRNLGETKLAVLYFVLKNYQSNKAYAEYVKKAYSSMSKSNFFRHVDELAYMDLFYVQRVRHGRSTILQFVENLGCANTKLVEELVKNKFLISEDN